MSRWFIQGVSGPRKIIWIGRRDVRYGWRGVWIGWNTPPLFSEREGYRTGPHRIGRLAIMFGPARRLRNFP